MEARPLDQPDSSEGIAAAGETARRVIANVARVIHAWVDQLFSDLDRLNNHYLTAYVRRSFFPHWGEVG